MMKRSSEGEVINFEILRQYASFQEIIMKDQAKADSVYEIIKSRKMINLGISEYDLGLKKGDDLSHQSQPVIIISGMRDDFCQIVNINNAASTIFGYSKNELMGKKVELLMSDIYARVHDTFVSNYVSSMKGLMINKERFVMAKHKTRHLIPVTVYIKVSPVNQTIEDVAMQTLHFCGFFKPEKITSEVGYVLTTDTGDLLDISAGVLPMLSIALEDIKTDKNITNWVEFFNQFPDFMAKLPAMKEAKGGTILKYQRKVQIGVPGSGGEIPGPLPPLSTTMRQHLFKTMSKADSYQQLGTNEGSQFDNMRRASMLKRKILEEVIMMESREMSVTLIEQTFTNFNRCLFIVKIENPKMAIYL